MKEGEIKEHSGREMSLVGLMMTHIYEYINQMSMKQFISAHYSIQTKISPSGLRPVVIQSFLRRVMMRKEVATTWARDSPAVTGK